MDEKKSSPEDGAHMDAPPAYSPHDNAQPGAFANPGFQPQAPPYVTPGQPTVVTMVIPHHQVADTSDVKDYLVLNAVAFFFCWPIALFGLLKALECRSAKARGDRASALANAATAKKMGAIALVCGIVFFICLAVYLILLYTVILPSITYY